MTKATFEIVPSQEEIDRVMDWAHESPAEDGFSYQDGLRTMYDWLTGADDMPPDFSFEGEKEHEQQTIL